MKLLSLAFLLLSALANAQSPSSIPNGPCARFLACGTYEGNGALRDSQGQLVEEFSETATISQLDENTALVDLTVTKQGRLQRFPLELRFQQDGTFKVSSPKGTYAAGTCRGNLCTYGMMPFGPADQITTGNSGIFRFREATFERFMTVVFGAEEMPYQQLSVLKKK